MMQCGPKEHIIFQPFAQTNVAIENEQVKVFQFCFQLWEA